MFPDLSLLYFEIEIPEPARDPMLTADVLNFLQFSQLRKSIYPLCFSQHTDCWKAQIQLMLVKLRAMSVSHLSPVSGNKMTLTYTLINKYQACEMPCRTAHACFLLLRVVAGLNSPISNTISKLQVCMALQSHVLHTGTALPTISLTEYVFVVFAHGFSSVRRS